MPRYVLVRDGKEVANFVLASDDRWLRGDLVEVLLGATFQTFEVTGFTRIYGEEAEEYRDRRSSLTAAHVMFISERRAT